MNIEGDDDDPVIAGGDDDAPKTIGAEPEPEPDDNLDQGDDEPAARGGDEPASRSGRADRREDQIRSLLAEAKAERAAIERERYNLESYQRQISQPNPQIEQERLAQMDPESRVLYIVNQQANNARAQALHAEFRTEARLDKMAFDQIVSSNPAYKKHADRVEKDYQTQLANAMRAGRADQIVPREVILDLIVGREARLNGGKALAKAQERGQRHIAAQTTRAANVSGNVGRGKASESAVDAARARLLKAGILSE